MPTNACVQNCRRINSAVVGEQSGAARASVREDDTRERESEWLVMRTHVHHGVGVVVVRLRRHLCRVAPVVHIIISTVIISSTASPTITITRASITLRWICAQSFPAAPAPRVRLLRLSVTVRMETVSIATTRTTTTKNSIGGGHGYWMCRNTKKNTRNSR